MVKVNTENVWKLTTAKGEIYYVKCPSKSGARIFLAEKIGIKGNTPFKAEISSKDSVPEGEKLLQAKFRAANDPVNWKAGNV
jgi:hypothetical protein